MSDPDTWHYVFSPHAMLLDGIVGLISVVLFRIVRGHRPRSLKAWFAIALIGTVLRHTLPLPGVRARGMPIGYVGEMMRLCMRGESQDRCFCAVDALKERIGDMAVVQLGVAAEANGTLPKEFAQALSDCSG